jgi:hypothetical protein
MKSWLPICLTVLSAGCTGVQERSAGPAVDARNRTVMIHFQTGFTGNWVHVKASGEPLFSGVLTTDNRIGLAATLRHSAPIEPALELTVTVDRSKTYPFSVDLKQGLYLGFKRNLDDGSIRLTQKPEPFVYD